MRDIAVISVGRSDYSILRPIMNQVNECPLLNLSLIVSGMHLSPEFGLTVNQIEMDGWKIREKIEHIVASDTPTGLAKSIGIGIIGYADLFSRYRPDVLVVMGDRFEMLCAAVAAQPFGIPVAHIHGGETTEGAIDESFRHSITKMSHIHFPTTEKYRKRILQLGEKPENVHNCGAPGLDNLLNFEKPSFQSLQRKIGITLERPPFVVTYHPETIDFTNNKKNLDTLINCLKHVDSPIVFTASNADTTGRMLNEIIQEQCEKIDRFYPIQNLGVEKYYELLSHAKAMIGNSSSGIIEAASFQLPVINIGTRQKGREHGLNVVHSACSELSINRALKKIELPEFLQAVRQMSNPYFNGGSSSKICKFLQSVEITPQLLQKSFYDI